MIVAVADAVLVVLIAAAFFLALALIAVARAIFSRTPPSARRFRVGVFVERDRERENDAP